MQEQEIRDLIKLGSESANLDYKEGFIWNKENKDKKYELLRDLIAMANTRDGGRIIFGVRDNDYLYVGASDEIFETIDPNNVVQMLHQWSDPKVSCQISKLTVDGKRVIVFDVTEFDDTPIICIDSIKTVDQSRLILRKGSVYIRTAAAATEEISSSHEMRELLGRAIRKKSNELLGSIEKLITGKPTRPTSQSVDLYSIEIDLAEKFLQEVLGKGFLQSARWEFISYPVEYNRTRISELPMIEKLIRSSEVYLRGWNFPHLDRENESNFDSGLQSFTDSDRIREGFRLYQSSLFLFERAFWEDAEGGKAKSGKRTLSFISAIYVITELTLFLKRAHENLEFDSDIRVIVKLFGCKDRELASYDGMVHLEPWYVCRVDSITIDEIIKVVELKASFDGVARRWIKHIFHIFNWNNVSDDTIENWQKKLIERRL